MKPTITPCKLGGPIVVSCSPLCDRRPGACSNPRRRKNPTSNWPCAAAAAGGTSSTRSVSVEVLNGPVPEGTHSKSAARRLILLRHANATATAAPSLLLEDRSLTLRDHDRPLSNAGRADAINVSQHLQLLGWIPELILSSDALRTRETLKIMQDQVQAFLDAEVHFISSFYSVAAMDGQTAEHLQQAICKFARDEIFTVMCMGHNKGWEEAASVFSGATIELKACNAALLEATGKSWEEAFALAGLGGWKLQGIVRPTASL